MFNCYVESRNKQQEQRSQDVALNDAKIENAIIAHSGYYPATTDLLV